MTPEELLRLYAERVHLQDEDVEYILSLFGRVAEREKEACAKVAESLPDATRWVRAPAYTHGEAIAAAIRARGAP